MKNVLILGLLALLLFSVSATMSLWLNQPQKGTDETATAKEKAVARKGATRAKADDEADAAEPSRPVVQPRPHSATGEVGPLAAQVREQLSALKDREARLDRRQAQLDLILGDIRSERQVIETIRQQVGAELKQVGDTIAELERKAAELEAQKQTAAKSAAETQRRTVDQEETERKNLDRMASVYDSMPAENAARILQQMADMGKLDTAVKLLAQMKERQAAKVLAEISDPALAAQLLDKMRVHKRAPKDAAATPAKEGA